MLETCTSALPFPPRPVGLHCKDAACPVLLFPLPRGSASHTRGQCRHSHEADGVQVRNSVFWRRGPDPSIRTPDRLVHCEKPWDAVRSVHQYRKVGWTMFTSEIERSVPWVGGPLNKTGGKRSIGYASCTRALVIALTVHSENLMKMR